MKRYLIPIIAILVLASVLIMGCAEGLQTFNKYGISFNVSRELKLEEYTLDFKDQALRKGDASYEEGAVISAEKNFWLFWVTPVPPFTSEEIRYSILSTPDALLSPGGTIKSKISGDLTTQRIADFEVTFANMEFTFPAGRASGITAVWYSSASQRVMQLIIIHKQPKREMERFIRSFSDVGTGSLYPSPSGDKSYLEKVTPIMRRHAETTETSNKANRAFIEAVASSNEAEVIKALTNYKETLSWALSRVDSELADFKKLIPPPEARRFHSLVIDILIKEQDGLANLLSYYSAVLRYGSGDSAALNRGNNQLLEAQRLWQQAMYELADLQQKFQR